MFILELIREALRNLARHKLRSLLTTLGIIFGVASVLSMVAIGEGARLAILDQISELGIRNVIINTRKPPEEADVAQEEQQQASPQFGLTFRDADQIHATLPFVERVLPVHDVEKWIWFKSRRVAAKIRGVTPDYFEVLNLDPMMGRSLTAADGDRRKRVAVIRGRLLQEAGYVGDPLELDLRIGTDYYEVIGVLPDFEFQSPNKSVLGIDDRAMEVYVPFETAVDRFGLRGSNRGDAAQSGGFSELHQIVAVIAREDLVLDGARAIQAVLHAFHDRKDYEITVPLELLEQQQATQRVFNIVLPIIAGISLLVGGIGILNIMLASITERTREIGIRRAIGATGWDITWQFLVETVTLSTMGGVLGLALGMVTVEVLQRATQWQAVITPWSLALSLGVSCLTGIVFGIYPARRAAKMDPIRALRHS